MALAVVAYAARPSANTHYAPLANRSSGVVRVSGRALIDLNTADAALLMELDGIGDKLAERILEARAAKGYFESVDALLNVPGIAEGKLDAIRPRVTACP